MSTSGTGLRVTPALIIPEAELSWQFAKASGPGGQGVNTTDSRAELRWDASASAVLTSTQRTRVSQRLANRITGGVLIVSAAQHRSQLRNRQEARSRLAALVADAIAPPARPRRATKPTRGSKERRLRAKKHRGHTKQLRQRPDG